MNINELRYAIESSFVGCRTCSEPIDTWPDAEPKTDPGHKVMYVPREALFVGVCNGGHYSEFYLAEVKADEITAHDITERTCNQYVSQADCKHAKRVKFQLEEGEAIPTQDGVMQGPATGYGCVLCMAKFGFVKGEPETKSPSRSKIVGLDGNPL